MSNNIYYIYKITNLINNKIYIGFTSKTPEIRFHQHIRNAEYKSDKTYFHKAIRKYGQNNFIVEKLDESTDYNYCLSILEPYYIKLYNSTDPNIGYNLRGGGEGGNWSIEARKKLSESKNGIPNPNKGLSYEEIYGKERADIIKQKIKNNHFNCSGKNNSFYGKKHTKKTIDAIKQKVSGDKNNFAKSFIVYDKNNNILYKGKGINNFAKQLGYKYPSGLKKTIKYNRPIKGKKYHTIYDGCFIKYIEDD